MIKKSLAMTPHVMKTPMKVRNSIVCRVVYEIKICQDHTKPQLAQRSPNNGCLGIPNRWIGKVIFHWVSDTAFSRLSAIGRRTLFEAIIIECLLLCHIQAKEIRVVAIYVDWSKGVFTWENSHWRESHTGMIFWFRIAFTLCLGHFISLLFEGTLHVDQIHVWFKIENITHALPVPVYRQTDFTPKRVVVPRLHNTAARFRTGVKFSPRYKNWGELTSGWLAPAWHFVVVSCKQI